MLRVLVDGQHAGTLGRDRDGWQAVPQARPLSGRTELYAGTDVAPLPPVPLAPPPDQASR